MEHKYNIGDVVHFLNFNQAKIEIDLLHLNLNKVLTFKKFHCCGKIVGIHLTSNETTYDIQTYAFNLNPLEIVTSIPEDLIEIDEYSIKRIFVNIVENNIKKVREFYENN